MKFSKHENETLRQRLCALQRHILEAILNQRANWNSEQLSSISEETAADTIYAIDRVSETAITAWFQENWPTKWPVEIIMEGLESEAPLCFPAQLKSEETLLKCIIDPIDGTRGLLYDKRSAWILTGLAPQNGAANSLRDIHIAAMTEIPTSRSWRCDQLSAVRGEGICGSIFDLRNDFSTRSFLPKPSSAEKVHHAFATICRFFPAGSTWLSEFEQRLWGKVHGPAQGPSPLVFNDQYICTGGQFYEMMAGHDCFVADLRPLAFKRLGIESNLACHPYDVATALLLQEAGCIIESPDGSPLDCPLDTTTPVNWVAYANQRLADHIRPALQAALAEML